MYAIISTGGKQTQVRTGDVIDVERLKGGSDEITFTPILVVDTDGAAVTDAASLAASTVTARVVGETKGPKIDIFKYKNKTGYRRRMGHRQVYTRLEVTDIAVSKAAASADEAASAEEE